MNISPHEQWCPFAVKRIGAQGLDAKRGYKGVTGVPAAHLVYAPKRGEIKHDSTGPLAQTLGVLDNHPINSWQFTIDDSGIYQHYPIDANCWHGNDTDPDQDVRANIDLVGIEHTRAKDNVIGVPRKLSVIQTELTTKLTRWLSETRERPLVYRFPSFGPQADNAWELCEHNEVGNDPTACPSGRIPWEIILKLLEGDAMLKYETDHATNLQFLYLYNGDKAIRRYGSTMRDAQGNDERAGRECLNFGGNWLWWRHFTDEGYWDAAGYLSDVEGD